MLTDQKYRADFNSRRQSVWEYDFHSGLWDGICGRSRGGRLSRRRWLPRQIRKWLFFGAERWQLLHRAYAEHALGLPSGRDHDRRERNGQRTNTSVASALSFLILTCGVACSRQTSPQFVFDRTYKAFLHGNLRQSQDEAH